ncbi:extracellular solute-binding protein [Treponema sp. OttesenSCG-928-L16]|nr:extracellular solute-binding protein [Treponema sp. OttesenSCG-928-L16]
METKLFKRIIAVLLILSAGIISLYAGGEGEQAGTKEKITFLTTDAVNFRGQLEEFIREFNASSSKYEVVGTFSGVVDDLFVTGLQSNKPHDITFVSIEGATPYMGTNRIGTLPESFIQKIKPTLYEYVMTTVTVDGKVYGVPYNFYPDWGQIMINDTLWAEAGVDPRSAKNWDEFMALCQKVTKFDSAGKMIQSGFSAERNSHSYFMDRIVQLGGIVFNDDGSAAFNNAIGKQAVQNYVDIYLKWKNDDPLFGGSIDSFKRGSVAAMRGMPWFASILDKDTPNLKYSFIPVPQFQNTEPLWPLASMWAHIISKQAEKKDGVWEFLEFLLEPERMVRWALYSGELPAVESAANDARIKQDKILAHFVDAMQYGVGTNVTYWASRDIRNVMASMLQSVIHGQSTIDDALAKAAAEVTRLNKQR